MTAPERAGHRPVEWFAALTLFALLAAAFLHEPLRTQRALLPSDLAFQYDHVWVAMGRDPGRTVAQNPILADVSDYYYPYRVYTLERLRSGHIPLWNPYILAGTPFFASAQAALLDPVTAASLLAGPFASWAIGAWLRLTLLGFFTFGLARALGRGPLAATAAGIVFMVCGFVTVWLNYPVVTSLVWLPALLWAALRLIETGSRRALAAVAVANGLLLVGGHPETQFLAGLFFVAFCVQALALRPAPHATPLRRRLLALAAAVTLGAALGAVQWVPFVEFLFGSHAFADRAEPFPRFDGIESLLRFVVLLLPNVGGKRMEIDYWMPAYTNYVEQTGYVGLLALGMAGVGLVAARRRGGDDARWALFFAAIALLMVGFAVRAPGLHFVKLLPLFDVGHGVRWVLVASLCVALLAARGIDAVLAAGPRSSALRRTGFVFVAVGGIGWLALALVHASLGSDPWISIPTRGSVTRIPTRLLHELLAPRRLEVSAPLLFLLAGGGVLVATSWARRTTAGAAVLCGLLYLDLWSFGHAFNPVTPRRDVFPENATLRHLGAHLGRERVVAAGTTLRPNVAMVFGLRDLRGYEDLVEGEFARIYQPTLERLLEESWLPSPRLSREEERLLQLGSVRFLLSTVGSSPAAPYRLAHAENGLFLWENDATLPRAFAVLGARFAPDSETARESLLAPDFDPFREVILTGEGPTRGTPGAAPPVTWRTDEPENLVIEVTLPAPGYLVLGDRHAPEWQATVDGEAAPILRANGAFRAVALPAGTHEVRFTYRPRLVYGSAATSGLALLVVLGLLASTPQRRASTPSRVEAPGAPR